MTTNKVLLLMSSAVIVEICAFSLLYFVFDFSVRETIFSTIGGEIGFLIAWFSTDRIGKKRRSTHSAEA